MDVDDDNKQGSFKAKAFANDHLIPNNDYGKVRIRWDPEAYELNYILPAPHHDFTFTERTGWRYYPRGRYLDRLGDKPDVPLMNEQPAKKSNNDRKSNENGEADTKEDIQSMSIPRKKGRIPEEESEPKRLKVEKQGKSTSFSSSAILESKTLTVDERDKSTSLSSSKTVATVSTHGTDSTLASNSTNPQQGSRSEQIKLSPSSARNSVITTTKMAPSTNVPKAVLYALYGKKPRRVQISATDYITWDNGAKTHETKHTSFFVCPITKEVFLSGEYGEAFESANGFVWYPKKALAEHAAAAKALDCWNLRENLDMGQHCFDEPYLKGNNPKLPVELIPTETLDELKKAQGMKIEVGDDDMEESVEENPQVEADVPEQPAVLQDAVEQHQNGPAKKPQQEPPSERRRGSLSGRSSHGRGRSPNGRSGWPRGPPPPDWSRNRPGRGWHPQDNRRYGRHPPPPPPPQQQWGGGRDYNDGYNNWNAAHYGWDGNQDMGYGQPYGDWGGYNGDPYNQNTGQGYDGFQDNYYNHHNGNNMGWNGGGGNGDGAK